VHTGFRGKDTPLQPGQRGVEESTKGVIEAIESVAMENTGSFIHGNYGEGIKPMDW
jgi:dihydroxyacetone kinase